MLTTRFLGVAIVIGLALAIAGVARSPASADGGEGQLMVREHQLPSDGMYIEGYVAFLRVRSVPNGDVLIHRRFDVADPLVRLHTQLKPGTYRVIRFIRPCDGNCGVLDHKTERCAATVEVTADGETHATVRTRMFHRCEIRVKPSDT
jgi:hypothetical protein